MTAKDVALVTGASRGIGRAIAEHLCTGGFYVIGTATTDAGAQAISAALEENGHGMTLDVSSPESVTELFKTLTAASKLPAVIVNNAGITKDGLLARMSEDDWNVVINTNLSSVYRMCKAAARHLMKARRGRIINITSVVGETGNAGQANYAAAKAGLIGLTKSLARELASRNITVNAVAPGFIHTDMTAALPDGQKEALLSQIPLGRLGAADDIAGAVAFLASAQASYVTGQTLHVNGGMYMG